MLRALPLLRRAGLSRRAFASALDRRVLDSFATTDPTALSGRDPYIVDNLLKGEWVRTQKYDDIVDPLNGEVFIKCASASTEEAELFVQSLASCSKSGLHNPLKDVHRYVKYGEVSNLAAEKLRDQAVAEYFAKLIQRVSPKSFAQAMGEVRVTRLFLENFSGDQVRFLARGFSNPGDHTGQESRGYRWPFGPVAVITPFNFPLEIPVLQLMGALFMGNKPVLKVDSKVAIVMEQFMRLLMACGMPHDADMINCDGPVMNDLLKRANPRNTLFTGSSRVARKLALDMEGRVRLEDAGFDWKILGPDVGNVDYVAWQCDQDAYACSGQKCSAQSILFMHENWAKAGLVDKLRERAAKRRLQDLTVGPVLTWTTEAILEHTNRLLRIPGAKVLFGNKELKGHRIPKCYGAIEPTAIFVPLEQILRPEHFPTVTTEVFGPMQVVTEYKHDELPELLEVCERLEHHLTAAVVSNDAVFVNKVLGNTVNGTTYVGLRARTTGAPQNHWFGPAGDPRGAGIGTPEAIQITWSCHRELIHDTLPVADGWNMPEPT